MSWFDNMGMATDFTGDFDAEGALVLNAEYTLPGHAREGALLDQEAAPTASSLFQSAMPGPDGGLEDRDGVGRDGRRAK